MSHEDQRTIDAFLPGRSITSLKWRPHLEELQKDAPIYTPPQEFHHLRYFSYGGYSGRPLLSVVTPHLPALEVLELIGLYCIEVCSNSRYYCASHKRHGQELGMLSEIPRLRVFILSNALPNNRQSMLSLEERKAYFPQIFTMCKTLQHIDINIRTQKYQRWFRDGSPNGLLFDVDEVLLSSWNIS